MLKGPLLIKNNKGTSIVIYSLLLSLVLAVGALVTDIGLMVYEKSRLHSAADSAALAGAQELVYNSDNACSMAAQYLVKNGVSSRKAEVGLFEEEKGVRVSAVKDSRYFFAGILGLSGGSVQASAAAVCAPVVSPEEGVRPFAIEEQELEYGEVCTLKAGGGEGTGGNYGALALGGTGASNYLNNITSGHEGSLKTGDYVETETGNMSGPTKEGINQLISRCRHTPRCSFDNHDQDCSRIITVIVVDSLDVDGRKTVFITGFAAFFLEGVLGEGNESVITGRFIRKLAAGAIDPNHKDFGLMGIKLVE